LDKRKFSHILAGMKSAHFIMALALVALTACKIIDNPNGPHHGQAKPGQDGPETVMVTYHVQAGREADFPALLAQAWNIYQKKHLVHSQPHVVVRQQEENGKTKFIEIFTWVNHAAPNKSVATMQDIWGKEEAACEDRNGHHGLEGGEVTLIAP
jgi:hypothetical protein